MFLIKLKNDTKIEPRDVNIVIMKLYTFNPFVWSNDSSLKEF